MIFTELSLGCWSSGHRKYQISSSTVFVSYMHIHVPLNVLLKVFCCCCFPRNKLFKHAYVRRVTELHLSTKFSAPVSEICELNQNKEKKNNSEIDYFQFNTFRGHILYPFFNQRYLLSIRSPLHHKLKVIILKYTIMLAKPGPSLYTQ